MDTQNRETSLRAHALAAHQRHEAENREREEQKTQAQEDDRRAFVGRWLSGWLGRAVTVEALPFTLDTLTFTAHAHTRYGYTETRLYLLWECPGCHELQSEQEIGTDYQLGAFLADPQPGPCAGCQAEEEEYHHQQPVPPAAPPPETTEQLLLRTLRDYIANEIADALANRDEAESTRDYYRSEREERHQRRQAAELRRVEEQHHTDTYRLEDDLRRTQEQLKRQQRGW